jgi:protein tyrosine/serine phosphatase
LIEDAKKVMAANETYLAATFKTIRQQYGSIDEYLETVLGVDASKRKALQEKIYNNQYPFIKYSPA